MTDAWDQAWESSTPSFGSSTPLELQSVFIPLISELKNRSEAILQRKIDYVHFATPWIDHYSGLEVFDQDDAFVQAVKCWGSNARLFTTKNKAIPCRYMSMKRMLCLRLMAVDYAQNVSVSVHQRHITLGELYIMLGQLLSENFGDHCQHS